MSKFYGKLAPEVDPRIPSIHRLLNGDILKPSPLTVRYDLVKNTPISFGMLGNDSCGDCTIAGALHMRHAWLAQNAEEIVAPETDAAIEDYAHLSGYDPATRENDTGLSLLTVLRTWMVGGLASSPQDIDRIAAFAAIDPHDTVTLRRAIFSFGGVYAGMLLPESAETEFDAGAPWSDLSEPGRNGHCVCLLGYDNSNIFAISWGRVVRMSHAFWLKYAEEAFAVLDPDWLLRDECPAGISKTRLTTILDNWQHKLAGVDEKLPPAPIPIPDGGADTIALTEPAQMPQNDAHEPPSATPPETPPAA